MLLKRYKLFITLVLALLIVSCLFIVSITMLSDPLSKRLRKETEHALNTYVKSLAQKASQNTLSTFDKSVLHLGVLTGTAISRLKYPEASELLFHYVYGDGSELELSSLYFERSDYLRQVIKQLGVGEHGPITLKQADDWRLSLAFNPYYLNVSTTKVCLYHPNIRFATVGKASMVFTTVPIGKLNITINDGLVSALDPTPFRVYSEWTID